jgi:2-keto-4-pentenoate hydratase/2-oxohepta-3-ene-1,7-dioic acid hydratase in catechol pathway
LPEINSFVKFRRKQENTPIFGILGYESITELESPPWFGVRKSRQMHKVENVELLAPVSPSKIICVGLNYHAHVGASQSASKAPDQPMLFFKPPSSIIGPEEKISYPEQSKRIDYEAELGVVIGRRAKNVPESNAHEYIFGYTCVNDVTARDLQKTDGQWGRAKGFDTFCPVGPRIVQGIDSSSLAIQGILNGSVKQAGNTKDMIFNVPFLISYISSIMTLEPGDLISTGTPAGIEPMNPGDTIEVKIDNIGSLKNYVVSQS